jgi:hypothetical protein
LDEKYQQQLLEKPEKQDQEIVTQVIMQYNFIVNLRSCGLATPLYLLASGAKPTE